MSTDTDTDNMVLMDVTPEQAKEWLESNRNRAVRPEKVEWLARIILNGEWELNGDSIRFDHDGVMIDGQHRCLAIAATGITVPSYALFNLNPVAQETIDNGTRRTLGDTLYMRGEKSHNQLAATLHLLFRWQSGNIFNSTRNNPTRGQALELLDKHPEVRDAVKNAQRLAYKIRLSSTIVAATWYRFSQIDADDCRDFWEAVTTGYHLDGRAAATDSGPYVLNRYLRIRETRGRHKTPQFILHAVVIKAWNAYRENRSISQLAFKAGGANIEKFPEPV